MDIFGGNLVSEQMWLNMDRIGDVTFAVGPEKEQVKGFVCVLRSLSPVFDTIFDDENNDEAQNPNEIIELPEINPKEFRLFLKLLFVHDLKVDHLNDLSMIETLHLLYISNKYDVPRIQSVCKETIKIQMKSQSVILAYETLRLMNKPEMEKTTLDFIKSCFVNSIDGKSFSDLSKDSLREILQSEELDVQEGFLLFGTFQWAVCKLKKGGIKTTTLENVRQVLGDLLHLIRFPLLSHRELFNFNSQYPILTSAEMMQVSKCIALKGDPAFVNDTKFNANERVGLMNRLQKENPNGDWEFLMEFIPESKTTFDCFEFSDIGQRKSYLVRDRQRPFEVQVWITENKHFHVLPPLTGQVDEKQRIHLKKPVTLEPNRRYVFHFKIQEKGRSVSTIGVGKYGHCYINFGFGSK